MAQWTKCLLCKYEDLNPNPSTHVKARSGGDHLGGPCQNPLGWVAGIPAAKLQVQ